MQSDEPVYDVTAGWRGESPVNTLCPRASLSHLLEYLSWIGREGCVFGRPRLFLVRYSSAFNSIVSESIRDDHVHLEALVKLWRLSTCEHGRRMSCRRTRVGKEHLNRCWNIFDEKLQHHCRCLCRCLGSALNQAVPPIGPDPAPGQKPTSRRVPTPSSCTRSFLIYLLCHIGTCFILSFRIHS